MKTAILIGMVAVIVGPAAAGGTRPAPRTPSRAPAPAGSLLADTLRREQAPILMALARARSVRPVSEASKPEAKKPVEVAPETRAQIEKFYGISLSPTASWLDLVSSGGNVRVSLQLEEATVRDALKQIFDQAKLPYTVDEDVPEDAHVTVKAANVRLHTALNLITEAAGVGWTVEQKLAGSINVRGSVPQAEQLQRISAGLAGTYRIGKSVGRGATVSRILLNQDGSLTAPALKFSDTLIPYSVWGREERSTFTCPHCKAQSTLVRVKSQPKCPKCERTYQPDWQFCPADGTKRPTPPADWRFCPSCGKQVKPEKASESGELPESLTQPAPAVPELPPASPALPAPDPAPTGAIPTDAGTYQP